MNIQYEGEPELRAESALDRVTSESRAWNRKRPRAFSARDALAALQFEVTFLHVVSATMRDGTALADEDHARLVMACGRIHAIVDEAIG